MLRTLRAPLALLALAGFGLGLTAQAQIERLTLDQMVARTDDAVFGEIVAKEVIRIDHPIDGPELYYTHLTLSGRSLATGEELSVVVTYAGGFIDDEHGVWNSEAPSEEETRLGTEVVAFYQWTDNMGGDLGANALYASHGGLYRTVNGRKGRVVLGRGEGYAVRNNERLIDLDARVSTLRSQKDEERRSW